MNRKGFAIEPLSIGFSEVVACSLDHDSESPRRQATFGDDVANGSTSPMVALLLGTVQHSMAAIDDSLVGYRVSHVISVASGRNSRMLQLRLEETTSSPVVSFQAFRMRDSMPPDEHVDISIQLADPLRAVEQAISKASSAIASQISSRIGDESELPCSVREHNARGVTASSVKPAVLVHCDMGHNRSPTLVLAFLVRSGLSLRQAYKKVLQARPSVDPLPSYRRGLEEYEMSLHRAKSCGRSHRCSVSRDEHFALHISELFRFVETQKAEKQEAETGNEVEDESDASCEEDESDASSENDETTTSFDAALLLRERSIKNLLVEGYLGRDAEEEEGEGEAEKADKKECVLVGE
eukprot:TRINITY_DN38128_c0_g1_i1.p1 TRINITY_DN38128_c0_g1~~TRINITY_DN38128_c0_g1_i1.p1  ORF type:complete len:353 (+),score=53.61 TRINITY_DN38128_c0_g1_i1:97-1155(+)